MVKIPANISRNLTISRVLRIRLRNLILMFR